MDHAEDLPRAPDAGARARLLLSRWFGRILETDELDRAKLIASELVNNAVIHGKGTIRLQTNFDDDRLLIEVTDEGEGFEHVARKVPFERLSGRGLSLVDAEASRWGVHEGTTHVWAEIERTGPRLGREAKPEL